MKANGRYLQIAFWRRGEPLIRGLDLVRIEIHRRGSAEPARFTTTIMKEDTAMFVCVDASDRFQPHRSILWAVLLIAWLGCCPVFADIRDSGQFFDSTFGDFSEELENAKSQGKRGVLLMFEMDECPFCHRMKSSVLNQAGVQDYFKAHFLIFAVDVEGDVEITDFAGAAMPQKDFALKSHRVRATPVFAFFDTEGALVAKYTGATRDADEFMLLGRYVVEGHYKDESFQQFKRGQQTPASR